MESPKLVVRRTDCDGIGNVLKCFITTLSISANAAVQPNPGYLLGDYASVLQEHQIEENPKEEDTVYSCRLLVLKAEEAVQPTIENEFPDFDGIGNPRYNEMFSPHLIDFNYDPSRISPIVRNRIFNAIDRVSFRPEILATVDRFVAAMKASVLGVSVRTWTAPHERNIQRPYHRIVYFRKIHEVLTMHPEIKTVLLSVDNPEVASEYLKFLKHFGVDARLIEVGLNHIQSAVCKALILSKCDYFIGNRISTFSELVFWFGKHRPVVFTVY